MAAGKEQQQAHRSGIYKQKNKQHKHGKHRTKGEIGRENKGRVAVVALTKKQRRELSKMDRRHKANQLRRNKKDSVLSEKRRLGSRDGPPHLVAVIGLHARVDTAAVTRLLRADEIGGVLHEHQGIAVERDSFGLVLPRFKQRFTFYRPDTADLHSLLDVAKVADSLVFVLEPTEGWDSYGDYCLSCLFAQGLPSHALVCQGIADLAVKKRTESRRTLSRLAEARFPEARLFPMDTEQDAVLLLRHLGAQKQRRLAFRSRRSHMLVQSASYTPSSRQEGTGGPPTGLGTLQVSGYVRGCPMQVNRLVHIAGHGDFQLSQIDAPTDPLPIVTGTQRPVKPAKGQDEEMMDRGAGEEVRVLMKSDPSKRESLQTEAEVDPMDGEQTWPTESELQEAEEARKSRRVMKVPKGTSDYQATWIVDDDDENEDDDDDDLDSCDDDDEEDDADEMMEDGEDAENDSQDGEACYDSVKDDGDEDEEEEEISSAGRVGAEQKYDEGMDEAEEEDGLKRYREARSHEMFPDEVDTPLDVPARTRFQRYRGLKSFRSSLWDPMENLPLNYSRIFQFQNFERTRRRVLAEAAIEEEGAMVGWYVTLHIEDVPVSVMESFQAGKPLVLVSLLPHEQKMSVMHLLVRRQPSFTEPIASKEELVFQCGFRRFRASPIFSQHTTGDKHKMERFLRADAPTVVSVYAPITFPTAGVLVYKQRANGMQDLVATGSLLSCDPQRVVLKRIVLSGHPFKINRRSAVVRYMFFNRDDILWFKPVELRTKWGRRGHIKEALGTHGHMKCVFDSQLRSQDTVLMNLYKRVYPRWTYDPYVPHPVPWVKKEEPEELHDIDME
ncbi:pre-rRNA-processing protein TSR1 homolog isoform X1 [Pangasianodon hypophthalmus]|uniref:pre-rRNA-processing protein TSR1 homolog isoform X1 n=1 Tax=Pangasianodon hypophthalmus TaxID=310915 RepID=UPI002307A95A|nr:pre-rRNA-processing protein TSR1 homolog isoform X1 [Pangasianodon hypophthalmus]